MKANPPPRSTAMSSAVAGSGARQGAAPAAGAPQQEQRQGGGGMSDILKQMLRAFVIFQAVQFLLGGERDFPLSTSGY
jgi:hypothetical protein